VFDRGTISKLDNDVSNELEIGDIFFTLEFAHGKPLDNYIGRLSEEQFLEIVKQISTVLLYLHGSCFVYFDLKFENIFINEDDDKLLIKFIDLALPEESVKALFWKMQLDQFNILPRK
jgi:serine/threonine protein kinase